MTRDEIFQVVKGNIQKVIEASRGKEITEAMSMRDFNADSLEIVEVVSRSMKELKIKVPRTELSTAKNIGELVSLLEKHASLAKAG
jgi:acyl carrier protein